MILDETAKIFESILVKSHSAPSESGAGWSTFDVLDDLKGLTTEIIESVEVVMVSLDMRNAFNIIYFDTDRGIIEYLHISGSCWMHQPVYLQNKVVMWEE